MAEQPFVRQMIHEAITALDGHATYQQIKEYVWRKYGPEVKANTLNAQIAVCTVNHDSRIYYPENAKPRLANDKRYDFLYRVGRGEVVLYEPQKHGPWQIVEDENGKLMVAREDSVIIDSSRDTIETIQENSLPFPLESHLRDFIARNLSALRFEGKQLELYTDEDDRNGVEYPTTGGNRIDILATDEDGNFVVFELKVGRGIDATVGQILRYIGWVKHHLARPEQTVKGAIVVQSANEWLRYAVSAVPDISLFEYEVDFRVKPVTL